MPSFFFFLMKNLPEHIHPATLVTIHLMRFTARDLKLTLKCTVRNNDIIPKSLLFLIIRLT